LSSRIACRRSLVRCLTDEALNMGLCEPCDLQAEVSTERFQGHHTQIGLDPRFLVSHDANDWRGPFYLIVCS